jgi:hypothetical protein
MVGPGSLRPLDRRLITPAKAVLDLSDVSSSGAHSKDHESGAGGV